MAHLNDLECCGLREIDGLSHNTSAEAAMKELAEYMLTDFKWRHAIFSQAGKKARYGRNFSAYIKKHKLGTVVATLTAVNPNSHNPLKAFVWTVNWPALRKWCKKHKVENPEETSSIHSSWW